MEDVTKTAYAKWLEEFIKDIMEYKPERIGVCMLLPNGGTYSNYFGDCGHLDKALMGYTMNLDAIMEVTTANADQILAAAEAADEEQDGDDS
jgi:hypothetical protein